MRYQYKVMPAPESARKFKGVHGARERFALTLEDVMNASGLEGWAFVGTETLSFIERGWFRSRTTEETVLVFRRALDEALSDASASFPVQAERHAAPERTVVAAPPVLEERHAPPERAVAQGRSAAPERDAVQRMAALRPARDEGPRSAPLGPARREAPERVVPAPGVRKD